MRERLRGSKKVKRMIREIRTLKAEGKDVSQKKGEVSKLARSTDEWKVKRAHRISAVRSLVTLAKEVLMSRLGQKPDCGLRRKQESRKGRQRCVKKILSR